MTKIKGSKPTYFTIESDGSKSLLHVDCFRKRPSGNSERILIIHDDKGVAPEQFKAELNNIFAKKADDEGSEGE